MSICLLAKRNISISSIQLNKCFISIKQTNKQREKKKKKTRKRKRETAKRKERKKSMCRIIILTIE